MKNTNLHIIWHVFRLIVQQILSLAMFTMPAQTTRRSGHLTVQPDSVRKNLSCDRRTDTLFPLCPLRATMQKEVKIM